MGTPRWASVALFLAILFVALAPLSVLAGGPPVEPPGLEQAIAAQEAHTDALLGRAGVVGTAVGVGADGQAVVKIYTSAAHVTGLPHRLDSAPVEVEVTGEFVAQSIGESSGTERLIISGGQLYCTTGTLGALVTPVNGTLGALSNAHVYAGQGSTTNGTVQVGQNGDWILQPGRVDMTDQACGSPQEIDNAVIGRLWQYVPIKFSRKANNTVDAAIAWLTGPKGVDNTTPPDGYGTPSSTPAPAVLNLAVQKYGRTTGLTKGTVTGVNATVFVRYDKGVTRFVKQVITSALSGGGDSGSLIVTQAGNHPVALLFAGSSSSTIGNPIDLVLGAFGVTIDGGP